MKKTDIGYPSFTKTMKSKCDPFAKFFKDVFVNDTNSDLSFGLDKCVDMGRYH